MEKPDPVEPMPDAMTRQLRHLLPVITSEAPDGSQTSRVLCPRTGAPTSIQNCGHCGRCLGVMLNVTGLGTVLKCAWQAEAPAHGEHRPPDGPTIAELMTPAPCVACPETTVEAAADCMLQRGISEVAVVDEHGKAVGVISTSDLLRKYFEDGDLAEFVAEADRSQGLPLGVHSMHAGQASVHEVMNCSVLGLSAGASVARAAALMAYEGVPQLVVLNSVGGIEGVITSLDILRWLATTSGFALPSRPSAKTREPKTTR